MNINLLLELKYHIEQGNEAEAFAVAKLLAEDHLLRENPNLKLWDNMLYFEVIHKTIPLIIENAKIHIKNSITHAS